LPSALERGVFDGVLDSNAAAARWKDLLKVLVKRSGLNFFEANIVCEQGSLRQASGTIAIPSKASSIYAQDDADDGAGRRRGEAKRRPKA